MKNVMNNLRPVIKTAKTELVKITLVWLLALLPAMTGFTAVSTVESGCPEPANLTLTEKTASSISYSWSGSASAYKVYYVRHADGYQSPVTTVSSLSHTFTNLASGTYSFYFASECDTGSSSYIVTNDVIL